jgi:hypothetical protein
LSISRAEWQREDVSPDLLSRTRQPRHLPLFG